MREDDFYLQQRLDNLRRRAEEVSARLEEVFPEAFKELIDALAELQAFEEKLRQQNKKKVSDSKTVEMKH